MKKLSIIVSLVVIALIIIIGSVSTYSSPAFGAVSNISIARVVTTATTTVGPQAPTILYLSNYSCAARIISTQGQPIMLGFGATSTAIFGNVQAASTTVMYKASDYGCGLLTAYGFAASTTITITQTIL